MDQVFDERIDVVDRFAPEAVHIADRAALAQFALLADGEAQPRQFFRHALVLRGDVVEGVRYLAGKAGPFTRQAHAAFAALEGGEGVQDRAEFIADNRWMLNKLHDCPPWAREDHSLAGGGRKLCKSYTFALA